MAPTSWVRSSSIHGLSSALMRVQSCVSPSSISEPTRISPSRAASLRSTGMASSRLPSRMSTCGAMSGALATIFSFEKSRKWIIRDGLNGISRSGSGASIASGLKKSRGLRMERGSYSLKMSGMAHDGAARLAALGVVGIALMGLLGVLQALGAAPDAFDLDEEYTVPAFDSGVLLAAAAWGSPQAREAAAGH